MRRHALVLLALLPLALDPTAAHAQEPVALPMDELAKGSLNAGPAQYTFVATTAGVLTVFARADDDADLTLEVTDDLGQLIEGGNSDSDLFGQTGTERVSVVIRRPGTYQINVGSYSDSASFHVGGSWLVAEAMAIPEDPDGHPSRATPLPVATRVEGSIDPSSGDDGDWYVVTAEIAGLYTVITEGEDDVYLEYYLEDDFSIARDHSDQDEGGSGNESVTVRLEAGARAYLKIGSPLNAAATYSLRTGVM